MCKIRVEIYLRHFVIVTAIQPDFQETQNSLSNYVRNSYKHFHENLTDALAIDTRLGGRETERERDGMTDGQRK